MMSTVYTSIRSQCIGRFIQILEVCCVKRPPSKISLTSLKLNVGT